MMFLPQRQSAFTLIETVIVIALSASIVVALTFLLFTFNKASSYGKISSQSYASASTLLREIESLALPANAVLETHSFSGTTYTSTATSLVLELPSIDGSGNVITNAHDYVAFYAVGTNAYRLLEKDATSARVAGTVLLSSTLSAFSFAYDDADFVQVRTITVDIQTQAQVKEEVVTNHLSQQIRLRNHQ